MLILVIKIKFVIGFSV